MRTIKSPLRYPGGKSKVVDQISARFPASFAEYREPFVGGGSVFISLRQRDSCVPVWINDLNHDLICFWRCAQEDTEALAAAILHIRNTERDGQVLFKRLVSSYDARLSDFERAVRFFVLNRVTFSGTVDSGGFSQKAFEKRFTLSSIERLRELGAVVKDVKITNLDYREVLRAPGKDCFVFLDPPYLSATKSKLYGRRGALHVNFDHVEFAHQLRLCTHRWLVTYDDSPEVRKNFRFANIHEWEVQYGMNNFARSFAPKGKELFISNYDLHKIERAEDKQFALTY